jgi:alkylation response protein AidB-like acyl-CoA dehydrogenase
VAGVVAALDGQSLCVLEQEPPHIAIENLGAQPLADRSLQGSIIVAEGDEAQSLYSHALDEWRVLSAARLVGAGWRSLQIAIEYAKSRNAFGVPIASYQAVNHRMADLATGLTGARLLVWRAAWELDHSGERTSALASMAYSFSAEQAEAAASDALHFHGGYGFMMEYDAQLYLRRVKTWATQLGDLSRELRRVADGLWPLAQVGV